MRTRQSSEFGHARREISPAIENFQPRKIALVVSPWTSVETAPLTVAALKAYLASKGIPAECRYLNLRLSRRLPQYSSLACGCHIPGPLLEFFFGYHLFGPGGSGDLDLNWEEIKEDGDFKAAMADGNLDEGDAEDLLHKIIPQFIAECLEEIPWGQYELIAFVSFFKSHIAALKLSREIKQRFPSIPIVFGGATVEGEMGSATLKGCPWVDYVVDGEGENILWQLVENIRAGQPYTPMPGLSFRTEQGICAGERLPRALLDMNTLPTPDPTDLFKEIRHLDIQNLNPSITFETSRGCWWGSKHHCPFCGFNGKTIAYRQKSPELALRDFLTLHTRHNQAHMIATDTIMPAEYLRNVMPALAAERKKSGSDWKIFYETKANMRREDVKTLADAGVRMIQTGIESLSPSLLRLMKKGVRAIQSIELLKNLHVHEIFCVWNIIYGIPGGNAEEYTKMSNAVLPLVHLQPPIGLSRLWIARFTPYHSNWQDFGISRPRPKRYYHYIYPQGLFNLEEMSDEFESTSLNEMYLAPDYVEAIRRLKETIEFWQRAHPKSYFAYAKTANGFRLFDGRPAALHQLRIRHEETSIEGAEALIFELCHDMRARAGIHTECRSRYPEWSAEAVDRALEDMVNNRWLVREDDFYLNVAIPYTRLPRPQLQAFIAAGAI